MCSTQASKALPLPIIRSEHMDLALTTGKRTLHNRLNNRHHAAQERIDLATTKSKQESHNDEQTMRCHHTWQERTQVRAGARVQHLRPRHERD